MIVSRATPCLADCCGGCGGWRGGRLLTAPAAGMMSAGDGSQLGTCTAQRPETEVSL